MIFESWGLMLLLVLLLVLIADSGVFDRLYCPDQHWSQRQKAPIEAWLHLPWQDPKLALRPCTYQVPIRP